MMKSVLVTGGAGYVGSVLVPKLLKKGHRVTVIDLMLYGEETLNEVKHHPNLKVFKNDIRDRTHLETVMCDIDAVIHLACISNDPSYELDPELSKSINYGAFLDLVAVSVKNRVELFIYASSSSVYGAKEEPHVTEDLSLEPLTDYSKYKALCEKILLDAWSRDFTPVVIRPSTVCGYSPRMRLDLTVNLLTNHACNKGEITVFGGDQKRPNIHIEDMTDLYCFLLECPEEKIAGKIFNAGYQNYRVMEIAEMVKHVLGADVHIAVTPSNDPRSYHVSSEKIRNELGYVPKHAVEEAILDIRCAFEKGLVPNPLNDSKYYNVMRMKEMDLQ
jgi:nucleoside-diphosphate-sugar epimerase